MVSDRCSFGPYELRGLIGRGGMGEVYRAFHREQRREVALKVLPVAFATNPEFVERFRRESYAAAGLNNPHVVPIHSFGEIDGQLYLEMRLVDGVDLAHLIGNEGPLAAGRALMILDQAAQALDAAHANQLVHRDVKPSNLLITAHDFVYLVDFGIAHNVGLSTAGTALTATGATIGTLDYMAPERFLGYTVDRRVDVYSLACVFYESLTGRPPFPFPANNSPALLNAHLNTPPPRPTSTRPDLPPAFDEVVARGMAKNPADRYPTAPALAVAAAQALQAGFAPRPVVAPVAPPTAAPRVPAPSGPPAPAAAGRVPTGRVPTPRRSVAGWVVAAVGLGLVTVLSGALLLPGIGSDAVGGGAPTDAPAVPLAESTTTGPAAPSEQTVPPRTADPPASAVPGEQTNPAGPPTSPAPAGSPPQDAVSPSPAGPVGDLGLATPISAPPCDGGFAVVVGSAIDPPRYREEVQAFLDQAPGSGYLLTEQSCRSLAPRSAQDTAIYAVYLGPFGSLAQACTTLVEVGGDSYLRRLDDTSPVGEVIDC